MVDTFYHDNPPNTWEECGCCEGWHPSGFTGDCRDDENRWPSEAAIQKLIIRAVNCHEALVSALQALDECGLLVEWNGMCDNDSKAVQRARAALAKAWGDN